MTLPIATVMTVTPEIAEIWLRKNTRNRSLRKGLIAAYARDMAAGHWPMNGESVKFSVDGDILDGQHRLKAVIAAGVSVPMMVVTGLPPEVQMTMDSGAKRTAGDVLTLQGNKNSQLLASVLRKVWMWDRGDYKFATNTSPTMTEIAELIDQRPDIHRSVEIAARTRSAFKPLQPTVTGTAHHLLSRVDQEAAVWFFARVADGAALDAGHPILTLRNRVANEAQTQVRNPSHVRLAYVIRAWNAVREGRDLARIIQTAKDPMPMPR